MTPKCNIVKKLALSVDEFEILPCTYFLQQQHNQSNPTSGGSRKDRLQGRRREALFLIESSAQRYFLLLEFNNYYKVFHIFNTTCSAFPDNSPTILFSPCQNLWTIHLQWDDYSLKIYLILTTGSMNLFRNQLDLYFWPTQFQIKSGLLSSKIIWGLLVNFYANSQPNWVTHSSLDNF